MLIILADWISIAWIAEENPGIRPMDACANFLSKGVIHLLLTIVLFYRFTAWRLLNRSISRAIGTVSRFLSDLFSSRVDFLYWH